MLLGWINHKEEEYGIVHIGFHGVFERRAHGNRSSTDGIIMLGLGFHVQCVKTQPVAKGSKGIPLGSVILMKVELEDI